jgi:hypothetical protein
MNLHLTNLKSLKFGGASCVIDPTMDQVVKQTIISCAGDYCFNDLDIQNKFVEKYFSWIQNSKNNSFKNLDKFAVLSYSNGTTEGFDKFYINNNRCRFRIFRGEYMYHGATWKSSHPDWKYIEDEPLRPNDAVIVSAPFSDTGNIHPRMSDMLDQCHKLSIPVLVDCAFVGICGNIEFDFDHPAITDITFSLSKTFPVANLRIGMRCRRQDNDDGILIHQKTNYTNRLGSAVGLSLIEKYSVDHNFETWRSRQLQFCKELNVEPSDSVIFGLGDHNWSKYNRGTTSNRLCFSRWFAQKDLPTDD